MPETETACTTCGPATMQAETCPECGEVALQQEGGCSICQSCFWSPCK